MLIVADINTLWRARPFEALSRLRPVLGLRPLDRVLALKQGRFPLGTRTGRQEAMVTLTAILPCGWATRRATRSLPRLWSKALKTCQLLGGQSHGIVVTSPHYAPLVQQLSPILPTFYYCSDDYLNYAGWNAVTMRNQEEAIFRCVKHSFFVSAALCARAVNDYGVDPAKTSVSMNATEERFLAKLPANEIETLRNRYPKLKRPIAGVVGGINERLDFALLLKLLDIPHLGSLLFVGPVSTPKRDRHFAALRAHPKSVWVGPQPHDELAAWQQMLDAAVIPYRQSEFNTLCSPLRLFDHLASGRPTVATDFCPQVAEFSEHIGIARSQEDFIAKLAEILQQSSLPDSEIMRLTASKHTWAARAGAMNERIIKALTESETSQVLLNI